MEIKEHQEDGGEDKGLRSPFPQGMPQPVAPSREEHLPKLQGGPLAVSGAGEEPEESIHSFTMKMTDNGGEENF